MSDGGVLGTLGQTVLLHHQHRLTTTEIRVVYRNPDTNFCRIKGIDQNRANDKNRALSVFALVE